MDTPTSDNRPLDRPTGPVVPPGTPPAPLAAGRAVMCPTCGAENRANRLFCSACSAYLRGDEDTWEELPPPGWLAAADSGLVNGRSPADPSGPPSGQWSPPLQTSPAPSTGPAWTATPPPTPTWTAQPPPRPAWTAAPPFDQPPSWEQPPAPPSGDGPRRRRSHLWGILLGLLLILAVATVVLSVRYVYQRAEDGSAADSSTVSSAPATSAGGAVGSSTTTSEAGASTSTTAATAGGGGTLIEPVDVSASSSLPPESGNDYSPPNFVDGDITTAWSEGIEGAGEGEWIQVGFDPPVTLTALEIANGYQKDLRRFEGNPRVLELRLKYSDGTTQSVRLYDDQGWQFVTPVPVTTNYLRLTIVSVYPGDTWDDTSLSELRIFGRE